MGLELDAVVVMAGVRDDEDSGGGDSVGMDRRKWVEIGSKLIILSANLVQSSDDSLVYFNIERKALRSPVND